MPFALCPLYPILDASYLPSSIFPAEFPDRRDLTSTPGMRLPNDEERNGILASVVESLAAAGVTMLQYRNKHAEDDQVLRDVAWLRRHAPASMRIILNDRVHLVKQLGCDGVHLGQTDLSIGQARMFLGKERIIGLSTHGDEQVRAGHLSTADYLAIGPVYATGSKPDAQAIIGLDGLRRARALTQKPLVAIGGITLARAAEVRAAGADSLAVISALFGRQGEGARMSPDVQLEKLAKDFLEVFR